jgi:protein tyrosine phosphatase (PTP) superfamily phosphohydrolase (DUF442 family)
MKLSSAYEAAIDKLRRPVAIICKSANRASLVYATYEVMYFSCHVTVVKVSVRTYTHLIHTSVTSLGCKAG